MPTVVGIRFKDSGKTYYFDPGNLASLIQGDEVVVETVRGPELAKITALAHEVADLEVVGELKPVLRRAEATDFERLRLLNERQDEIIARCTEKIVEHHLPMRLVKAEYSFDGSRLTFYFTADKRVDFRMLVRDLARTFKTRIELRQIGPRDEAKLLGGIGPCGRALCCATFLPDYARVSIKMAKDQDLPLNPSKISGVCGRLLCCLSYEHEQYLQIKTELPKKGAWVQTPDGPGEVVGVNVVRETVTVLLAETAVQEEFKPDLLQVATERVASMARSRNAEGITPAVRQPREPKHHGERRLLRNEIDNPDVLDALAMLEDNEWNAPQEPTQSNAPQAEQRQNPRRPQPIELRAAQERSPAHNTAPNEQRPPQAHTGPVQGKPRQPPEQPMSPPKTPDDTRTLPQRPQRRRRGSQ